MTVHTHQSVAGPVRHDHQLTGMDPAYNGGRPDHSHLRGAVLKPGNRYRFEFATQKGNNQWWWQECVSIYVDRSRDLRSVTVHGDTMYGTMDLEVSSVVVCVPVDNTSRIRRPSNVRRMSDAEVLAMRSGRLERTA